MSKRIMKNLDAALPNRKKKPFVAGGEKKLVSFAPDETLETVHLVESFKVEDTREDGEAATTGVSGSSSVRLTEEITLLSTVHGRARRYLRDISKVELQAAVKYGVKEQARPDPRTGLPRWKYKFGNVVYITDHTSRQEVTCYKDSVSIEPAPISQAMLSRHEEVKQILQEEPQLCTSHTIVILDQSGSMRTSDVNGYRNRSQAAYGSLALDYVAERLYQQGDPPGADSLSLVEMNDTGTLVYGREPIDWLLFNKLLDRKEQAMPRSHGNYCHSVHLAAKCIEEEMRLLGDCDHEDLPNFALVFLSDGKPSDKDICDVFLRTHIIRELSEMLKDKLTVFCMGLGASGSDFEQLSQLATIASTHGATADFVHAGLSAANLGKGFSSISSTMTSLREDLLKTPGEVDMEDNREIVALKNRNSMAKSRQDCRKHTSATRFRFNTSLWEDYQDPWESISLRNEKAVGFEIDRIPFGKGAERLAFRFQEVDAQSRLVGKMMVAKESKGFRNEKKKLQFHADFCRTQIKAGEIARLFNQAVRKAPSLKPINEFERLPKIVFLKCHVYVFRDDAGKEAGLLVEEELKGKFTKYNSNNGFVKKNRANERSVELQSGEVLHTDFLSAFSHWSYVHTDHKLLVCDLQGVLNEEGRMPFFHLTDPAICSTNKKQFKYGKTDLGVRGVRTFCLTHKCTKVCKCLGLAPVGTRKRGPQR